MNLALPLEEPWLNAGILALSQPTLYVGRDVATAESQQSEQGDDNYALKYNLSPSGKPYMAST